MADEEQQEPKPKAQPDPQDHIIASERREDAFLPWLGTTRFWIVAASIVLVAFLLIALKWRSVHQDGALIPVVTISGPVEVTKGETVNYAVLVRDRNGAPIPHANVRVGFWKRGLIELGHAVTSDGGDANVEVHLPDDFAERRSIVAVAEVGAVDGYDDLIVVPPSPGKGSLFVSTDKPLYQPGQTVHVRALAMAGDKPIADKPALIEIRTPFDGIKIFRAEKRTSAFGIVSADFILADQVKLGRYPISVTVTLAPKEETKEGTKEAIVVTGEQTFEVKRYSLPKLKLAFEDVAAFTPEGPLRGNVRATWIFGEPVTKGAITVELVQAGSQRGVTGHPDKDGVLHFELKADAKRRADQQPRGQFILKAKLDVEGGMHAETSREVSTIGGGQIKLEAFPESGVLVPGVPQLLYVLASGPDKVGITVRAKKDGGPVAKVSERGIAALKVEPVDWGKPLEIVAFGDDGSEGKLEVTTTRDSLVVRPDRASYKSGETARVTVLGAIAGEHISVRMTKGSEPIATGTCHVKDTPTGCEVSLAISKATSGLAWLHAMSLPKVAIDNDGAHDLKIGKRLILVGSGSRDLDLRVTPDKPAYAPRDVGLMNVAVTNATGAPTKAQLGVAVADEAVFLLANVRPDLERNFFTVDKDVARARGDLPTSLTMSYPSYSLLSRTGTSTSHRTPERALPAPYEVADAYDAATPSDVQTTLLSVLTTMHDVGGFDGASRSDIASRASETVATQTKKLKAYAVIVVALVAIALFAMFGLYGVRRYRRPLFLGLGDITLLKRETFGLMLDWHIAVFGPPLLALLSITATKVLTDTSSSSAEKSLVGVWAVVAAASALLLLRAVRRVRRVFVGAGGEVRARTFQRALIFLPLACFIGHFAIVLMLADPYQRNMEQALPFRQTALFLPIFIVGCVQITFGLLSVVRQSMQRETTSRQRLWLFASRSTFLGLPITLMAFALLLAQHVDRSRRTSWSDFTDRRIEALYEDKETEEISDRNADNKEGGTGTRARGEEGSMGSPKAGAPSKSNSNRYGVQGPQANDEMDRKGRPLVVRDYFPETLLWAPEVITDDTGHATIKVPFADSITTWRFGLRGVSGAGQLGSTTVPLVVKQDFFVEASLPAVLTQGDEIAIPVTVFSYTPGPQDVSLELESEGVSIIGAGKTALHLAPHEARGFRFMVRADKAGDRLVRLKALSPTHSDAIEKKISVTPNGLAIVKTFNGRVTTGSAITPIELPKGAIDGSNDLYAKIYGGALSQVSEGLDGVFRMPSGCFEQTSSTTYPSVLALDFLSRSKAVSPEVEKKARAYIADGYQRLVSFEVGSSGGFSLFGSSPASTTLSAYGLMEFSDMARVSSVDQVLIDRIRNFLVSKQTPTGGWVKPSPYGEKDEKDQKDDLFVTAYVAWAMAASTTKPAEDTRLRSALDAVVKAPLPNGDDPYALALRSNALLAGGRPAEAKALLDRLVPQAIRGEDGVHFTSKAVGVMASYGSSFDVEVTGLATHALALASMQPELRAGALNWLVARRGAYGTWSTTQATVAAMRALLDEAKPAPKDPQDITVLVDGEATETFKMETAARDVHHLVSLRRFAATGQHVVELRATGTGDISYQLVASHYVPWQRPNAAGLGLDVAYTPNAMATGATTSCHVELKWKGKEPARMPLVEIAIPPAFEVESDDLEQLLKDTKTNGVERYNVERGKITLYLVTLSENKPLTIDLRMRALRPARVTAPASSAYLYYEPEVRTETAPVVLRVQ